VAFIDNLADDPAEEEGLLLYEEDVRLISY